MRRALVASLAVLALAGCKAPMPTMDPVIGRSTVPPPRPGEVIAPRVADQYYPGAPAAPASATSRFSPPDGWTTSGGGTVNLAPTPAEGGAPTPANLTPPAGSRSLKSASPDESGPATLRASITRPITDEPALLSPDPQARSIASASGSASAGSQVTIRQASFEETIQPASASARTIRTRYDYDPNYAWLQGRLEYSPATKRWKLRYIPLDGQTDAHGGSVLLDYSAEVATFRHGDFVRVEGQLGGRADDAAVFSPTYRVSRIEKAD
jgi:hypothetical protein